MRHKGSPPVMYSEVRCCRTMRKISIVFSVDTSWLKMSGYFCVQ